MKKKVKTIHIRIQHQLTPFHEESMKKMLSGIMTALSIFWESKSKKFFRIVEEEQETDLFKDIKDKWDKQAEELTDR